MDKDTEQQNVHELRTRLAELVIDRILVPMISGGQISMDRAINRLQQQTVVALADKGKSKVFIGQFLGRCERWVHAQLSKARQAQTAADGTGVPNDTARGTGDEILNDVLMLLTKQYPVGMSASRLQARLNEGGRRVLKRTLVGILDVCVENNYLRVVEKTGTSKVYVATSSFLVLNVAHVTMAKLGKRLEKIPRLALSYCLGQGEFGGIAARLSSTAFVKARAELKDAVSRIMADALEETQLSDEPLAANLEVGAIFAIGIEGGSDDSDAQGRIRDH